MSTPLRPPRMTGDPATDSAGAIEYLWQWYRSIVEEQEFIRNQDIGSAVLEYDPQLAAIAVLTPTAISNLPYFTAEETAALTILTAFARSILDDADAATARATLGLGALAVLNAVGTTQITDDAVTYPKMQNVSATDKVLGRSTAGAGDVEEISCTAAGRALIDDADASAQRSTLGLGDSATKNVGTAAGTVAAGDDSRLVTNGNSHDHSGGDGAQIAYSTLSGLPTLGTMAAKDIGITETITTAKLTALGSDGSMTFVDGILTAQTQST